jgi:hypothetical protein
MAYILVLFRFKIFQENQKKFENDHFIPRNHENRFASVSRNSFGMKFRWKPYSSPLSNQ